MMFQVGNKILQEFIPKMICEREGSVNQDCTTRKMVDEIIRIQGNSAWYSSVREASEEPLEIEPDSRKATKSKSRDLASSDEKNIKKPKRSRTLFIIGDSHVRHLQNLVQHAVVYGTKVETYFQGGASLLKICNYLKRSIPDQDHIFVFGGTNDVDKQAVSELQPALAQLLNRYPNVKFTFILVPLRVHWNREYYQNASILRFNESLITALKNLEHKSLNFLDINQVLHAGHYSHDGVHLNTEGKMSLSNVIADVFRDS